MSKTKQGFQCDGLASSCWSWTMLIWLYTVTRGHEVKIRIPERSTSFHREQEGFHWSRDRRLMGSFWLLLRSLLIETHFGSDSSFLSFSPSLKYMIWGEETPTDSLVGHIWMNRGWDRVVGKEAWALIIDDASCLLNTAIRVSFPTVFTKCFKRVSTWDRQTQLLRALSLSASDPSGSLLLTLSIFSLKLYLIQLLLSARCPPRSC